MDKFKLLEPMTLEEAEDLCMRTDYAVYAVTDEEEINLGDAAAFFLEGYMEAISRLNRHL